MSAEIINMPRAQMLNAIRRDPALYVQFVFPFAEMTSRQAQIIRYTRNRSTSEIWKEMMNLPISGYCEKRDKLIEELNE